MSDPVQLLEAGGLVPLSAAIPAEVPTDTVDARGYRHPGLPDRVVVRLVADAIAEGIDVEMSLFGFHLAEHHDDVGRQRRRTLGFPGSTLVTDPERARYALDVMKEFKAQAKRIASKPGHARDGFDEIATRLQRQVPHFLPSYWEEVGRAFASAGNVPYAAQSFDKARAAEREFGLAIDEERRGEAFLEFALLGALTVKSLQAYAKELQKSVGGKSAYERMFALASRRTLGGLPPWASLPKDLRGLAKAAKLDVAAEDERFLREVIGGSALQRAPASFWDEYRDAVVSVAGKDPTVRARLLDLFPNGGKARYSWRNEDDGFTDVWMGLLMDSGALGTLWDADAPEAALPSGGRGAWFARLAEWAKPGDGWILQLLRRAAPTLTRTGEEVAIRSGDWYHPLDLDALDLVLELGLKWKFADNAHRVDLEKWSAWQPAEARHGLPAEVRPRDPVHAAREPSVARVLAPAVDAVFGNAQFEAVAAGMVGLSDLRRDWMNARVAEVDAHAVANALVAVKRLEDATSSAVFAEFPEALAALQRAELPARARPDAAHRRVRGVHLARLRGRGRRSQAEAERRAADRAAVAVPRAGQPAEGLLPRPERRGARARPEAAEGRDAGRARVRGRAGLCGLVGLGLGQPPVARVLERQAARHVRDRGRLRQSVGGTPLFG